MPRQLIDKAIGGCLLAETAKPWKYDEKLLLTVNNAFVRPAYHQKRNQDLDTHLPVPSHPRLSLPGYPGKSDNFVDSCRHGTAKPEARIATAHNARVG